MKGSSLFCVSLKDKRTRDAWPALEFESTPSSLPTHWQLCSEAQGKGSSWQPWEVDCLGPIHQAGCLFWASHYSPWPDPSWFRMCWASATIREVAGAWEPYFFFFFWEPYFYFFLIASEFSQEDLHTAGALYVAMNGILVPTLLCQDQDSTSQPVFWRTENLPSSSPGLHPAFGPALPSTEPRAIQGAQARGQSELSYDVPLKYSIKKC